MLRMYFPSTDITIVSVAQGTKPIFTTDHLSLLRAEGSKSRPALTRIITKASFLQIYTINYLNQMYSGIENLNCFVIGSKDESMSTIFKFCIKTPVNSIPIKPGKLVRPISHPPSFPPKISTKSWKSWPLGGAAISPKNYQVVVQVNCWRKYLPTMM